MRKIKYLSAIVLVFGLFQFTFSEKRSDPIPMKELTDPSSPSYVPIPYPENREDIIGDLKYAVNKLFADKEDTNVNSKTIEIKEILVDLTEKNSAYKIGKIIKVKNRSHRKAHDYGWLILIMGENGEVAARVSMKAEGLFGAAAATRNAAITLRSKYPNSRRGPQFLITEEEVITRISEDIGKPVEGDEIKKMERVAFQSTLGDLLAPMWEIKMSKGEIYYYSVKRDTVYEIEKKISWKKDKNGIRKLSRDLVPYNRDYVTDTVNDEILVLKRLKKKN